MSVKKIMVNKSGFLLLLVLDFGMAFESLKLDLYFENSIDLTSCVALIKVKSLYLVNGNWVWFFLAHYTTVHVPAVQFGACSGSHSPSALQVAMVMFRGSNPGKHCIETVWLSIVPLLAM